jgi:hypothetical protein
MSRTALSIVVLEEERATLALMAADGIRSQDIRPGTGRIPSDRARMALGAHSGNRLNGEYSVGLAPGLWVEDGAIVGIVKDAMVSGNVYDDLNNVVGVGDTLWDGNGGRFPCLLLDNVSFSART